MNIQTCELDLSEILEYVSTLHDMNKHNETVIGELTSYIKTLSSRVEYYEADMKPEVLMDIKSVRACRDVTNLNLENPEETMQSSDSLGSAIPFIVMKPNPSHKERKDNNESEI
jgi:hypothetical protein